MHWMSVSYFMHWMSVSYFMHWMSVSYFMQWMSVSYFMQWMSVSYFTHWMSVSYFMHWMRAKDLRSVHYHHVLCGLSRLDDLCVLLVPRGVLRVPLSVLHINLR